MVEVPVPATGGTCAPNTSPVSALINLNPLSPVALSINEILTEVSLNRHVCKSVASSSSLTSAISVGVMAVNS